MNRPQATQHASAGHLLGNTVRHAQPLDGHRTGIEPVLLAASIAARAGERVLEAGTGSGAALLCLAARVPGITGLGIERDDAMADLARRNALSNAATITIEEADIAAWRAGEPFDHAFANPPWHGWAGTPSPDSRQEFARRAGPGLLAAWITSMGAALRHKGTLTLIVATSVVPECMAALADAGCGGTVLFPLWAKPSRDAKLALLRGVRGGRSPFRVAAGLVLHQPDGRYTEHTESVLRHGAALML